MAIAAGMPQKADEAISAVKGPKVSVGAVRQLDRHDSRLAELGDISVGRPRTVGLPP